MSLFVVIRTGLFAQMLQSGDGLVVMTIVPCGGADGRHLATLAALSGADRREAYHTRSF